MFWNSTVDTRSAVDGKLWSGFFCAVVIEINSYSDWGTSVYIGTQPISVQYFLKWTNQKPVPSSPYYYRPSKRLRHSAP